MTLERDTGRTTGTERPSEKAQPRSYVSKKDVQDQPLEVEHAPPRLSQLVAVSTATLATLLAAPFTALSIPFGLAGVAIVTSSLFRTYSIRWLSAGSGMILFAALVSGVYGALPPELMLLAVSAAILAWDTGQYGIVLGEQLGRQTRSRRCQIVHVTASTLVVTLSSTVVYLVYLFGGTGRPASAVATVVLGIFVVAWLLRS